jgi:hypothetical protein
MDHLTMIVLACASIGAWVHAMRRKETPFGWRLVAPLAILFALVPYVAIEALRARGVWLSGEAQAAWPVIIAMGLGFTAATGGLDGTKTERGA